MPGKIQKGHIQTKSITCRLFCPFQCCELVFRVDTICRMDYSLMEQVVLSSRGRKENDLHFLCCLLSPNVGKITCFREILLWSCCRSTWYKALMPSSISMFSRRAVCCCSVLISCACETLSLPFSRFPWSFFTAFFFVFFFFEHLFLQQNLDKFPVNVQSCL